MRKDLVSLPARLEMVRRSLRVRADGCGRRAPCFCVCALCKLLQLPNGNRLQHGLEKLFKYSGFHRYFN
ncbi:hypothetical protein YC2023_000105 [Brassica napus]